MSCIVAETYRPERESWEKSLSRSEEQVGLMKKYLSSRGWVVHTLGRELDNESNPVRPDEGDLLIYRRLNGFAHRIHQVDVKQALQWSGPEFPQQFGGIFITTGKELHMDWWYFITNRENTHFAFVRPCIIPDSEFTPVPTKNRRGGDQVSIRVPLKYANFGVLPV